MQKISAIVLLLSLLMSNGAGQTNRRINLKKTTVYEGSTSYVAPNGTMAGSGSNRKNKYEFSFEGGNNTAVVSHFGNNLKTVLEPKSGAVNQMNIYSGKQIGAIFGGVGFVVFAILSVTAGMEETGETTTKPDQYGNLETSKDKSVTELGYTFLGLAGVSAIGGLYCNFSRGGNLRKAVELHNYFVENGTKTSLLLNMEF